MSAATQKRARRILPREKGAAPLDVMIGVMAFLAALALGGVLIAERAAETWQGGLTGRLSVQILTEDGVPPDAEIAAALNLLRATPGIVYAGALSDEENLALIEPWLGDDTLIEALPFPRMIDVQLEPGAMIDIATLRIACSMIMPAGSNACRAPPMPCCSARWRSLRSSPSPPLRRWPLRHAQGWPHTAKWWNFCT